MYPVELIKAGKLSEACTELVAEVKSSPTDSGKRTLLFQVYALFGEWDKAERHLDLIAAQDSGIEQSVQVYKNIINAEKERLQVLNEGRRPSFLPKAPPYLELYYAAREKLGEEKSEEAGKLFDEISVMVPHLSGTVNSKSFTSIRDTDSYLSFFLEAFVHEKYIWIPFESIRELTIAPPKTLFDLIWAAAGITTQDGLTLNCFLPVLYPESFLNEDDRIKLGRMTDWKALAGDYCRGMGQHVFQMGDEEVAILEVRELTINLPDVKEDNEKRD